jgi:hypothetical protein
MSLYTYIITRWAKPALERSYVKAYVQDYLKGYREGQIAALVDMGEDPAQAREQIERSPVDESIRLEAEGLAADPARRHAEEWLSAKLAQHEADQVMVCLLCGSSPEQQARALAAEYTRGFVDGQAQKLP